MNELVGASVWGMKCTISHHLRRRMLTSSSIQAARRWFSSESPVTDLREGGGDTDFLSYFNKEGKPQREPIIHEYTYTGDREEIYYGPVFTGDLEIRYLDYLRKLDWDSLQKHMVDYPRIRSENEVRLIFDKWAAHFGRKYPSVELKEMRYPAFKQSVDLNDRTNSRGYALTLHTRPDISSYPVSCFVPSFDRYVLRGYGISYRSFTMPHFCELSGTYDADY